MKITPPALDSTGIYDCTGIITACVDHGREIPEVEDTPIEPDLTGSITDHGGHGNGRKWPIVFSGMLFGDGEMASPTVAYPEARFGEDMHTAFADDLPYGNAWCGATVVYTGHMGVWNGETVSDNPGWGPYEHLPPDQWEWRGGEGYRRCCTSISWVGQALAARLMDAQENWHHDALFAYADRWMDPTSDAEYTQTIFEMTGWDYRGS